MLNTKSSMYRKYGFHNRYPVNRSASLKNAKHKKEKTLKF